MEAITVRQYEFHGLSIRSKVQLLKGYPKKRTAFQKYLFFSEFHLFRSDSLVFEFGI